MMLRSKVVSFGIMPVVLFACGSRTPLDEDLAGGGGGTLHDGGRVGTGGSTGTGGSGETGAGVPSGSGGFDTGGFGNGGSTDTGGFGNGGSTDTGGFGNGGSTDTGGFGNGGGTGVAGGPTGGFGGGVGGNAGYPVAQPGQGLTDILPGVTPSSACNACVQKVCPEAVKCSYDPSCADGFSCVFGKCPTTGRRGRPSMRCILGCFDGDIQSAAIGVQGITCIYQSCADECTNQGAGASQGMGR